MEKGDFSAIYFLKSEAIVKAKKPNQIVEMQFFHREEKLKISGIELITTILSKVLTKKQKLLIKIQGLRDGDYAAGHEPVFKISGPYHLFAKYEGIIDGILARCSGITTRSDEVVRATPKSIIFMGDRNDLHLNQGVDAYAAYVGGIRTFVSKYHHLADKKDIKIVGTMPHALIQNFNGNLVDACKAYLEVTKEEKLTALVDFYNDVTRDSIIVAKQFSEKLYAVRVDTSSNMLDEGLKRLNLDLPENYGASAALIKLLRKELNQSDAHHVKIIATSGFDKDTIVRFEKEKVPVDIYGVGSYLMKYRPGFTGDLVKINGEELAKSGRKALNNPNLKNISLT
jgi:nicotinate phosphoribosyltransferase